MVRGPGWGVAVVIIRVMNTLLGREREGREVWGRASHDWETGSLSSLGGEGERKWW